MGSSFLVSAQHVQDVQVLAEKGLQFGIRPRPALIGGLEVDVYAFPRVFIKHAKLTRCVLQQ